MDGLMQDRPLQEHSNSDCWNAGLGVSAANEWAGQDTAIDGDTGTNARMAWLLRTIEAEIIPRLMLAHQTQAYGLPAPSEALHTLSRTEVVAFASLVLAEPTAMALGRVEALRAEGLALDAIYLDLIAPAARYLGEMWEEDLCDFTQVTLGLWRLQQVMQELSPAFQSEFTLKLPQRRALLLPAPGSQHTLGLFMVAEFFRRAGWQVCAEPTAATEVAALVGAEWFDVVGFSAGADVQLEALSSVILELRKASRNPALGVLVGGAVFLAHPELVAEVGADATAADAPQAIGAAESLVAQQETRN